LLAVAPAAILQASYSRDMEREADDYALRLLHHNGLSGCWLSGALEKLEAAHSQEDSKGKHTNAAVKQEKSIPDFFASHPATLERRQAMCP
jgi:Zn-dependent protease with chaperone function